MKLEVDRTALLGAVTLAAAAVNARTARAVLTCLLIDAAADGVVTVYGTDQEVSVTAAVAGGAQVVEAAGRVAVPAERLRELLRELPAGQSVRLEAEAAAGPTALTRLLVRTGGDLFKLNLMDAKEFPPDPAGAAAAASDSKRGEPDAVDVELPAAALQELLRRTSFATARENTRYAFTGVLFQAEGQQLTCAATDSRRLAVATAQLLAKTKGASAVVPGKAVKLVATLAEAEAGAAPPPPGAKKGEAAKEPPSLRISFAPSRVVFHAVAAGVTVGTTVVEGAFPPYRDVIPDEKATNLQRATARAAELLGVVRRAALLCGDDDHEDVLRVKWDRKGLTLSARAQDAGESTVRLACGLQQGRGLEIGLNPGYVAEGLKAINGDGDVVALMSEPNRPVLFRSPDGTFKYVVMPKALQPA